MPGEADQFSGLSCTSRGPVDQMMWEVLPKLINVTCLSKDESLVMLLTTQTKSLHHCLNDQAILLELTL